MVRRILAIYDIQTTVNSRLLSGMVEVDVPTYQLSPYPRHMDLYWSHKAINGSQHGASWQSFNWMRTPTEERTLQIQWSDRIHLPQSSINFGDLIMYLGDLGLRTNPDGFWELSRNGLQVLPGTVLVWEFPRTAMPVPILVVAKPTIEHHGSLLLRFRNIPQKSQRTSTHLDPSWVELPASESIPEPSPTIDDSNLGGHFSDDISEVRIDRKGVTEKRYANGQVLPVISLPFWFTYSLLACTAQAGNHRYNGRPNGYRIRPKILYFSQECVIPLGNISSSWRSLLVKLLDPARIDAIPTDWSLNSPSRRNAALARRFELLIDDELRLQSARFRRIRRQAIKLAQEGIETDPKEGLYIPAEALSIRPAIWQEFASPAAEFISPLCVSRVPKSRDVCLAATENVELATEITTCLGILQKIFAGESAESFFSQDPGPNDMVVFLCALVVLESIATFSPYLAALSDIEACVSKWSPVYLC
jgi:hypothetical protein